MSYRIVIAADGSNVSKKTIKFAIDLCSKLSCPYQIDVLYCIGINPPKGTTALHLLSGLDRINNIEIKEEAKQDVAELNQFLAQFNNTNIQLKIREGSSHIGSIIEEYVNQDPPRILILGSSNKEGIQKFILGSTSDYCLHRCHCPVTIIKANDTFFQEVCFACHPLDSLESWKVEPNDGWTFHPNHPSNEENVLSNELYSLLTSTKSLRKLDLTDCCIGKQSFDGTLKRSSAIAIIGKTMQSGETNLSRLSLGKNKISRADFQELIEGIRRHRKSIKELYLHECGLEKDMIEMVLWTLMEKNPEQMISLDLSTDAQDIAINPNLVAKIIHTFRRLEILRMRGYDLLNLKYDFGLENSRLRELDISGSKLSTDTVARLCKWIQMTSFRTIEALHLVNCGLNGGYVYELLCSISRSGNRQMHLNLAENPVMKEVMHLPKLYSAIMQGEGPSSISFAGIEWDDSTLREFIDCLRDNQTITHLIFSDIKLREKEEISEDTVRMLTSFFERNMVIRELELNYKKSKLSRSPFNSSGTKSSFTNAVVRALYGLRHNSSLQYLDISGLNIGDAGALSLSRALKTNRVLQSIIIDDNSITIEGYRYLVKVIQESATQVIDMPIPRNDLRFQLRYLAYRVEELVISQNEAQFFLIHTVSGEKKRAKTHELEMIVQERKSCELALKSIHGVIGSLMIAIRKNTRHFIEQRNRDMEFQLQAQTAAQELATAQVRLQGRANSVDSFKLSTMGGRTDSGSRRGSLASSSTSSSVRGSRNNSGSYSHQQPSSHHPLVRGSTILNYDFYARSMSPPPSSNGYTSPSMNHVYLPRSKSETVGGKPHSFGSQLPPTPGEYYRPDFSDNSPLSPPLASAYSTSHVDDPGFIEDFGCVDDLGYVDGFELGPEPSYFQKPNASKADLDSIWDEDRVVDHLSRSLYLSSDARE
ncbi:hypothetical protein G6F42_001172 [Rhizopus arrhizus]|nr:hypothetical protein G6F42_001172 [Rhizopus arrhizus]